MPITEKQIAKRAGHIGSSDMAAIMGLDPWKPAYDVWLEKTGQTTPMPPNAAMQAGSRFEDGVIQFARDELGKLGRNQYRSCPDLHLGANIDAITLRGEPVECKTAGLFGPLTGDWGAEGTNQVPDHYLIQCHIHMICLWGNMGHGRDFGAYFCHLAAFLGGRGFKMYRIPWNPDLVDLISAAAVDFWDKCVVPVDPPPDSAPTIEIAKRIIRPPGKRVEIETPPVGYWRLAKHKVKYFKGLEKKWEREVLKQLEDAEVGDCELGEVTYLPQTRKSYTVKESTYRVLRFKENKNALESAGHDRIEGKPARTAIEQRDDGGNGASAAQAHDTAANGKDCSDDGGERRQTPTVQLAVDGAGGDGR